jgi:multicomponent Na+:H+ antiporter subunit B
VNPRGRAVLAGCAALLLFIVLLASFARLPGFGTYLGPYGTVLNSVAPHERHISNIVTAINFDYRGIDTMGEEFILFAAVAGLTLVLRTDRAQTTSEALPPSAGRRVSARTDAVNAFSIAGIGLTVAFGWYIAVHPHLGPGGGFQGGAITAGFAALLFLGLGYRSLERSVPKGWFEPLEAVGAVGYVVVGVATLASSGAFLTNTLPLGRSGDLFSTGTIIVVNFFVAVEVLAGFVVMFSEFADETRVERDDTESDAVA